MRALVYSLALLLPLAATASPLKVKDVVVQSGTFRTACDVPADQRSDYCACRADIVAPMLLNIAREDALNALLREGPESLRCEGTPVEVSQLSVNEKKIGYTLLLNNRHLLSIAQQFYEYPAGAAHGMSSTQNFVIEKRSGQQVELQDMLDMNALDDLNGHIHDTLRARRDTFIGSGNAKYSASRGDVNYAYITPEHCNECSLGVDAQGAFVQFSLYAVAPYASGEVMVRIPESFIAHPAIRKLYAKVSDAR